jgi:co-chaperonin GroES (HSP10)
MSIDTERPLSNAVLKDVNLELKDAGLVAASAAAEVDSTAQILDLGLGRTDAEVVLDVTAVEVESGDEVYTVTIG